MIFSGIFSGRLPGKEGNALLIAFCRDDNRYCRLQKQPLTLQEPAGLHTTIKMTAIMDSTDKATIRTLFKHKRSLLSTEAQQELDHRLLQQFRCLPLPGNLRYIMGFMPMQKFREPNVLLLIQDLQERCPGLQLALPRVRKDSIEMDALLVRPDTAFILSSWGIQEPEADTDLEPSAIDMIFIPLLAFDDKGYRVGYGKGVYDVFLQRCRPDVLKIGISYFEPVPEISDTYPGDIPLDVCITPGKIYTFNPSTAPE